MSDKTTQELQALVHALAWNDAFGCYTRQGFEKLVWPEIANDARYIVYFDINDMHMLNEKFGSYDPVDHMVKTALGTVRVSDFVAGQWKSGDEFLICLTEPLGNGWDQQESRRELDPFEMVSRLEDALAEQGLSATFAVTRVTSHDLHAVMQPAVDTVYRSKKQRGVGR